MSQSLIQLFLRSPHGKPWQRVKAGAYRGHAFQSGQLMSHGDWKELLSSYKEKAGLLAILPQLNGHFNLLVSGEDYLYAAVDIGRTLPLFWRVVDGSIQLTDSLAEETLDATRWHQEQALAHATFIPGHQTLTYGWQQLQAGELLEFRNGIVYLHTYFEHRRPAPLAKDQPELQKEFSVLIEQFTQRLIAYAAGRTIVIPLSGGFDSRLLLAALHQVGYPQVKAFTYGQAESIEVQTAKHIAQQLGVEWQFVAYTPETLQNFFTEEWAEYASFAANYSVLPQDQDWFALKVLRQNGWLPEGAIICPGYCGDFQAGSFVVPERIMALPWMQLQRLQQYLVERFNFEPSAALEQFWQAHLPKSALSDKHSAQSELEHWVLREYVSKYILNGVRAYEFWGCDWYLPLWDHAFITFWQKVPQSFRQNMALYRRTLIDNFFAPLNIVMPDEAATSTSITTADNWLSKKWKDRLKTLTPSKAIPDINGFDWLAMAIKKDLKIVGHKNDEAPLNTLIGQWYHHQLEQERVSATTTTNDDIW